jgi:HD-like signal output (HDOD) protein
MKPEVERELRKRVERLRTLPTSPAVLQPLLKLLRQDPDQIDLKQVEELVSYEKSIAAQCLRIANSPLYTRSRPTESIRAAILSLGVQRIEDILLSACLDRLVPAKKWAVNPEVFWRHSLGCALVCREFAERIEYRNVDKAYLAGLLHDLGILVNSMAYTTEYRQVIEKAVQGNVPLDQQEMQDLGFTHSQSGSFLGRAWQLPPDVVEVIEWHHAVEQAANESPLVALVHLGDLLCRLRGLGYGYDEWLSVEFASEPAWGLLSKHCPRLATMDLMRFTLDMDTYVVRVCELVDSVFAHK